MRRRSGYSSPKNSKTTDRPRHPAAEHAGGGEQREILGRYFAAFEAGTMVERDRAGGSTTVTVSERARQDSNLRPRAPEARALSPELRALR
jgi:hypothetical protein